MLVALSLLSSQSVFSQSEISVPDSTQKQLRLERVEIEGNTKTNPEVILGLLRFEPDSVITADVIAKNRERLIESGFFANVKVYSSPGSQKGLIVVRIIVTEQFLPSLKLVAGLYEIDGWTLSPIAVRYDNFNGAGDLLGLDFKIGEYKGGVYFDYANRSLFRNRVPFGIQVKAELQDVIYYDKDPDPNGGLKRFKHGIKRVGANTNIGFGRTLYKGFYFQHRFEFVKTDSNTSGDRLVFDSLDSKIQKVVGKKRLSNLALYWYNDNRDDVFGPSSGNWTQAGVEMSAKVFGSSFNYFKFTVDFRKYLRAFSNNSVAFRFKVGYIPPKELPDGDFTTSAPFYEKFYIGGNNSVRGYESYSLSDVDGANKLVVLNAEYRIPLSRDVPKRNVWTLVAFADFATVASQDENLTVNETNVGVGFGVRVRLPIINIVGLDIGFPVTRKNRRELLDEELFGSNFNLHFSIGHTY